MFPYTYSVFDRAEPTQADEYELITLYPSGKRPLRIRGMLIGCSETPEFEGRFDRCAIFKMEDGRFVTEFSRLTCWTNENAWRDFSICTDAGQMEHFFRRFCRDGLDPCDFSGMIYLAQRAMQQAGFAFSNELTAELAKQDAAARAELAAYAAEFLDDDLGLLPDGVVGQPAFA